jgi:phosphopantetheine adenylyltransferase
MAEWNVSHNPRAVTVFLQAADDYEEISSTSVRNLLREEKSPAFLVVPAVDAYLQSIRKKQA